VRNAHCERVGVLEGRKFDLNKYGQETSGKAACLGVMRGMGGDTFVFSAGRCEVWLCGSREALRASAGPGSEVVRVSLTDHAGRHLTVDENGALSFQSGALDAQSKFHYIENEDGTVSLKSLFGKYITAKPEGLVVAEASKIDDWEKFEVLRGGEGRLSFRTFHGQLLSATLDGTLSCPPAAVAEGEAVRFALTNHTLPPDELPRVGGASERLWVFSEFCEYQEPFGGLQGKQSRSPVFVKLWEWNYLDIARECQEYLGPNGFDAVQVSPVAEHILGYQWWTKYQPVSYGLNTRSGTKEEFQYMVATCRAAGVEIIVDVILNHMASACKEARISSIGTAPETPCSGWNGTRYGNRRTRGARGWDKASPQLFHHSEGNRLQNCVVGPKTGWLCGSPSLADCSCCSCDMYGGLPDWRTELPRVRNMHKRHLRELHSIGVTMLRVDAAIYSAVEDLGAMLNPLPWDYVFQEWWGEFPDPERTKIVGHYRDVAYRWKLVNALANLDIAKFDQVLDVKSGVHGVPQEHAMYPLLYHDGRTKDADSSTATYKNGLEFHQQQKFMLAWPYGVSIGLWGGFGWRSAEDGPPGCEWPDQHCKPKPVFDALGRAQCLPTPTESPLPSQLSQVRSWVCEHRWAGVAGLVNFRKACRGLPISRTWTPTQPGVGTGHLAYRLGGKCFVALVRGHSAQSAWGPIGNWSLVGFETGLPPGRYCDLSSLETQKNWGGDSCPREVTLGARGKVLSGSVAQGDLLAIHARAQLGA